MSCGNCLDALAVRIHCIFCRFLGYFKTCKFVPLRPGKFVPLSSVPPIPCLRSTSAFGAASQCLASGLWRGAAPVV